MTEVSPMRPNARQAPFDARCALAPRLAIVGILASAILIEGCSTGRGNTSASAPPAARNAAAGQVAALRAIGGSAVSGKIHVIDRGDGATVLVSVISIPSYRYRIAFHGNPNCSSPNGFSAGPVWAPASFGASPQELVPIQYSNPDGIAESELRIAGLHATGANGVAGRSVVLYAGPTVTQARPDVPNAAIACGVFEQTRPLAF